MLAPGFLDLYYSRDFRNVLKKKVKECPGCMYACYPEITYFCRDLKVFFERIFQGYRISRFTREVKTYETLLMLAQQFHDKYSK